MDALVGRREGLKPYHRDSKALGRFGLLQRMPNIVFGLASRCDEQFGNLTTQTGATTVALHRWLRRPVPGHDQSREARGGRPSHGLCRQAPLDR